MKCAGTPRAFKESVSFFTVQYFLEYCIISRISHYEQRLQTLYYLKRFPERMGDIKPKVTGIVLLLPGNTRFHDSLFSFQSCIFLCRSNSVCSNVVLAVAEASKQVFRSRKFRDLLEVVLAFGNYMNRGARGNAAGKW